MKVKKFSKKPENFQERLGAKPIICYPNNSLDNKNLNDKFIVPSDLIIKKVDKDNGKISDGQNSIIDYFTKDQLEILDNINKIESIGGIN